MRHARITTFCLLMLLTTPLFAEKSQFTDLRRAVPPNAYMAVWGRHNPERDYQRQYLRDVWETVEETDILERALKIVTSRMKEDDLDKAQATIDELREATQTMDWEAVLECQEVVYAQRMEFPQSHHLFAIRLTPSAAGDLEKTLFNLFSLVESKAKGELSLAKKSVSDVELTMLQLPEKVPFSPAFARIEDVVVVSTSEQLARRCVKMLVGNESPSKFDDPRLQEALTHLPEPEDSLLFLDGKQLFKRLGKIGPFIREQARNDEKAERVANMMDTVMDQLSVLDYQVAVEFTEGHHNCKTEFAKLLPGSEEKLLVKMLKQGQPFEDWHRWVPADAIAYSLTTGVNLHTLYEWLVTEIPNHIPESEAALQRFKDLQTDWELDIDRDILQAFSGETVSVTLPASDESTSQRPQMLLACRCHKPDEIRELLHRGVTLLQQVPQLKTQNLQLQQCDDLDEFEELSATILAVLNAQPVIGFHDGWMIFGSNPTVVQRVLDTRSGDADSIADSPEFQQFGLKVEGPVSSIRYTNLAEQTRQVATGLNQAGLFIPMIVGMAGADSDDEGVQVVQEVVGLLPSVARIVSKFDFLEKKIAVSQEGEDPLTELKRIVTTVRPPTDEEQ